MNIKRAAKPAIADRRARLVQMRIAGHTYDECAEALGYSSRSACSKDFSRILEQNIAEQRTSLEVYREVELLRLDGELHRLDGLYSKVEKILDKFHVTVSNGRVVTLDDEPLEDDGAALAAVDRLLRIDDARRRNGERRAKLMGLDAAQKVEMTIDDIDANIRDLSQQLASIDGEAGAAQGTEAASD